MSRTGFIYFSKPKFVNWDLVNIKCGDRAIIYSNDTSMQAFSSYYYVEIVQVDQENKRATIQMVENEVGAVWDQYIDLSIDARKFEINKLNMYSLPFNYLASVENR